MNTTIKSTWNGHDVKIKGRKVINKTRWECGLIVEGQAKLLAAVMFGYMAASITTQQDDKGTDTEDPSKYGERSDWANSKVEGFHKIEKPKEDNVTLVGTPVAYAPYQEFLYRPFLRPSLDMAKGKTLTLGLVNGRIEFREYLKG
jgi:hypothetical protein